MMETHSLLERGLAALNLDPGQAGAGKLERYLAQIEQWNPAYGLVGASGDELVIKHILDSLTPWKLLGKLLDELGPVRDGWDVSDLGTGAGLPGIPLSIIMPEKNFLLVERMGKRVTFLQSQKALLSLDNVQIAELEAERSPGPHNVAIFRAFRPFSETKLFRAIWRGIRPGGALFAYKGKPFNVKQELAAVATDPVLGPAFANARIETIWVPFLEEERCIVIVRKS
jgi:16S rRNA (guanine527-N7)-methyltransferase